MTDDEKVTPKSASTVIVELALQSHCFYMSTDGEPFAVSLDGPKLVRLLRGGKLGLRADLARRYRLATGRVAPQQALADALLTLEGDAAETEPRPLALRVAEHKSAWFLDLGDNTGRAVRVDPAGWSIVDETPVLFRRSVLTGPLPMPQRGGQLDDLWELLNVAEADRPLVLAWLVSLLMPGIPHPILALFGEQGTGKTSTARTLSSLLDPSPVPVRKAPRDADSWVTAAAGSWVVPLDNLSVVSEWLSDTLCRAVTGDGDVKRQLYTDGGLVVFAFRRCVLLTGIDLGALRGDLADRLLTVDLSVIPAEARRQEAELQQRWQERHPYLLGAVLDLAASVASVLPSVHLGTHPRMADFARVLAAVDQILGTNGLSRYSTRAGTMAADSLTDDPFVMAMQNSLTEFEGTSSDLLAKVPAPDEKRLPKGWPPNARALTTLLKRQAPVMRRAGWYVTDLPPGHDNAVRWRIVRPEKAGEPDSQHSRHSPGASDASDASIQNGQSQDGRPSLKLVEPSFFDEPPCDGPPEDCEACYERPARRSVAGRFLCGSCAVSA